MAPGRAGIFQTSEIIELTGPNGQKSSMPFTGPIPFEIGTAKGSEKFGKMEMKGKPGILAISTLTKMGVVVDLANQALLHCPQIDMPVIPARHRVMSVKAPELLVHPEWEPRVKRVTEQFPQVWARSKLDCGQIDAAVVVKGLDPPPQLQPWYPAEAEDSLWDTVNTLLGQGVLVEQESTCNAVVWPLRKADGKTWKLTVDFSTLDHVTPLQTSTVVRYPGIMAAISRGSEWFSVLSLTSPLFAIPLHPESRHKFAFTLGGRQFAFTRVPPGFHSARAICHAHVMKMWEQLSHRNSVLSCAGDVLIHTQTKEKNLEVLAEVLQAVQKTGFRINPTKAQLCWKEVSFVGVTLGEEGRSLEKQRVELIQKMSAPSDATTLRSFLTLLRLYREFIEGYAEKAAPLCHLLKKNTPWEWGPEQDEAVKTLKESVAQAPMLAHPRGGSPYILQLACTGRGLQASLGQQHNAKVLPVAHASRLLMPTEQQFTDYEREVLALTWALQHWEYLVGSAPVLLRTSHTPVRYLLLGKGDEGPLCYPRMATANWALSLTSKEIPRDPSPGAYRMVISGERNGQELVGPLTEPKPRRAPLFESSLSLEEAKQRGYVVWFVDGSNYHEGGVPYTGYAAVNWRTGEVVKGKCLPHSIQAAELVAVMAALENTPADQPLAIFSDSGWVVRVALEWLLLWRERDMQSADGKPVTYAKKLLYLARLAEQRACPAQIIKVKAHKKGTEEAKWNKEADAKAKEGAKEGLMWKASKISENGLVSVAPSRHWESVDLVGLQAQDPRLRELAQGREYKGCKVWKDVSGLVLARREGADYPVWVVPEFVRTELVALAHEQGHLGPDKTMVRLQGVGWWPEMREDVERYVSNCLMCAANNPDAKTAKALLGHQRVSGPWSKLQMEFIGPLPQTALGNKYCLVISDSFTKWVEAFPARNNTASATAKILVEHVFSRWGIPKEIDSEQGQRFIGEVTKGVCQALGIKQKLHITGHFQKPVSAEGSNQLLKTALRKMVKQQRKDWDQKLPLTLLALRGAMASQTLPPPKLPPTRDPKVLEHWWQVGEPPDELQPRVLMDRWVQDMLRTVLATYHQLTSVQETKIPKMDKQLGVLLHPTEWNMGDLVMYRGVREKNQVLEPQWMGPVRVVNKASPFVYQPVLVVCLWADHSMGLSFKFKISTTTPSFAAVKISKCHFLAWHAAPYVEIGNQVKLEIKYSQESVTDPMQISGTTMTVAAPNGRKWVIPVSCFHENKTLNRSELGVEASWYNQDYGRCPHLVITLQVWCQGSLSVEMSHELGGKWWIRGPEEFEKEFSIIAVLRPFVSKIGPYVVKQNHVQELLTGPVRSLKKVVLSLSTVNISSFRPHCAPFLSTLHTGWLAWLHSRSLQGARARRDLLATALGGGGAGLGVLNSMNAEVLANKLEVVTSGVQSLLKPLNSSLTNLGMGQWLVSEVLPTWEQINERDHQLLLRALDTEQNNVSLALSCIQAQMWVQSVVAGILRDGDNGVLPTEIRKIVWDAATEKERQLQAWWRLVNFTHDQALNVVIAHVLTVVEARVEKVYPIVALGVNTNGSVVYPLDHRMWVRVSDGKWQTVDLEACILERGLGFICEDDALKASDVCFDTKEGVCHFEINPQSSSKTTLVYVGKGCVCFRTMCKYVQINEAYNQTVFNHSNMCACNVTTIRGCDFVYKPPVLTNQLLIRNYTLYRSVTPTPIGMGLSLVKEMLEHENLQQLLENAKAKAKRILITVHHDGSVIKQVMERIKSVGEHHWWEVFFGWSPTATGIFNALLHPIVVILLMQICVCFAMVVACYWMRQVRLRIQREMKEQEIAKRLLP
ncbi:hypothetical protein WISP_148925 [Willisornis vidua]|uniref:Gypsy retrotransposon integrase-like protein 1 n=1 Tax=Willisornis vidua TaxID=1566151 RepID=A0ABQ9CK31_9PASS|nr:hypothetical protein WISP_148925 [Willisornis vidua]